MTSVMAGEETWIYGRGYYNAHSWVGGGLGRWLVNNRGEAGGEHYNFSLDEEFKSQTHQLVI